MLADALGLQQQLFGGQRQLLGLRFAILNIVMQPLKAGQQTGELLLMSLTAGAKLHHVRLQRGGQGGNPGQLLTALLKLRGRLGLRQVLRLFAPRCVHRRPDCAGEYRRRSG